jgi:hypothetical protein
MFITKFSVFSFLAAFLVLLLGSHIMAAGQTSGVTETLPPTPFRVGERLTYTVSFERYANVAFVEMAVVSRGRLSDRDAVELRSKIKTFDIVNAAFYNVDETRVVFASAESGMPLYVTKTLNNSVTPREFVTDYLNSPAANLDLLTLIYKIRSSGGVGTFSFFENEKIYNVNVVPIGTESVNVVSGQFDTSVTSLDSDFFLENGMANVRIYFTDDSDHIPALITFRTTKGRFRVELSGVQFKEPKIVEPQITPSPAPSPKIVPTPHPVATPAPYVDNQPLSEDLAFQLGEALDYRVTAAGRPVGTIRLSARERSLFKGEDTLFLSAEVISAEPGNPIFTMGDAMVARVGPETLAPFEVGFRSAGPLSWLNHVAVFDPKTGSITVGTNKVDAPIGTHSILSLVYALRSFNLKRSTDRSNPVNDTRVSVLWGNRSYVFSLRPSDAELIDIRGQKISAQMISINTGDPQLDALGFRIWLSNDAKRLPLRFAMGNIQADLFAESVIAPK